MASILFLCIDSSGSTSLLTKALQKVNDLDSKIDALRARRDDVLDKDENTRTGSETALLDDFAGIVVQMVEVKMFWMKIVNGEDPKSASSLQLCSLTIIIKKLAV
ncbi:hypothetical protein HK100_004231 [Physocladia obscura]|uniref:Uncharacterized protein n=1 Tax=Physocladia obscura TaxID=109957 RepID=A0AAD5ST18_9FUNG|nr:hypothetical protein HK100_004231 [Physocladia obscura]